MTFTGLRLRFFSWKPYFEIDDESQLRMRNVPVPRDIPQLTPMRRILGLSYAAHAVLSRLAPNLWSLDGLLKKHSNGEEVVCHLLSRLSEFCREHDSRFLVVTLHDRTLYQSRLRSIVSYAEKAGLDILDLAPRIADMDREASGKKADMFQPNNHLSPRMNAWVAEHIENHLRVGLPYADR